MIRRTLSATQAATFCVQLPSLQPELEGMPVPTGTGFFVSAEGWFVTARHVVTNADGTLRDDVEGAWLMKELRGQGGSPMCQFPELVFDDPVSDLALLKVDFEKNRTKDWLAGQDDFPHLSISVRPLDEAEPVYAFGYPLSTVQFHRQPGLLVGGSGLSPRVTSAIVASSLETTRMIMTDADPLSYVLDKALNYGNSGGPIVAVETGQVHAVCTKFQPVDVPQPQLAGAGAPPPVIQIPSLYGVVSSLANRTWLAGLGQHGVPTVEE